MHAPTHTYTHAYQPTHTHLGGSRALLLAYTKCPPPPTPPYRLTPKRKQIKNNIITTRASQVPELLCQSTDWINWKFYEVCGHLKWFSPVKSQYALSQCQHVTPYIRFDGVVELCSRLWLVVTVRQRNKRKGSIMPLSSADRFFLSVYVNYCCWHMLLLLFLAIVAITLQTYLQIVLRWRLAWNHPVWGSAVIT